MQIACRPPAPPEEGSPINLDQFTSLVANLTQRIAGAALDDTLQKHLNALAPPDSATYENLFSACRLSIADGWMCQREGDGIRYGRVLPAAPETDGFSVDVVIMQDVVGPWHTHPNGEIDLVMPLDAGALFDGHGAGWKVYAPGSAHHPTVAGGRALVLYLLPGGAIDFRQR